jgi:DNA-binding Lrp family transcriptional regulator
MKTRRNKRPRWTREEVAILKYNYRTKSNAEIAQMLGRKVSSVVFKGFRLNLSKCAARLREMGKQNIERRWHPRKSGRKAAR